MFLWSISYIISKTLKILSKKKQIWPSLHVNLSIPKIQGKKYLKTEDYEIRKV